MGAWLRLVLYLLILTVVFTLAGQAFALLPLSLRVLLFYTIVAGFILAGVATAAVPFLAFAEVWRSFKRPRAAWMRWALWGLWAIAGIGHSGLFVFAIFPGEEPHPYAWYWRILGALAGLGGFTACASAMSTIRKPAGLSGE